MSIKMTGQRELKAKLRKASDDMPESIRKGLSDASLLIVGGAQRNLTGGNPLNSPTGRLRNSVTAEISRSGTTSTAEVGTNVVYGRVHEYGATIKPKGANGWLRFKGKGGRWATVREVRIPRRPWLSPAFDSRRDRVIAILRKAVTRHLTGKGATA